MELLRSILRTNVESKAALHFSKAMGDNSSINHEQGQDSEDSEEIPVCTLNSAIDTNGACLKSIRDMAEHVLVALMLVNSKTGENSAEFDPKVGQELAQAIQSLITLTAEVANISTRFHETSIGLHVVVDFLRYPYDVSLLNFSSSGRVSLPHFSHVEASTMRLSWLHGAIEKALLKDNPDLRLGLEHHKIYSAFLESLRNLRNASKCSAQVFRVLMYSNAQGKLILQEFIRSLQPPERNDIIVELNRLRTQHELISLMYERVGWSLAEIWTEYTHKNCDFRQIQREAKARTEPLWYPNHYGSSSPSGSSELKSSSTTDKELRRKLQKKKKGKKNKEDNKGEKAKVKKEGNKKKASKKEVFMERLISLFGTNPAELNAPLKMIVPLWARKTPNNNNRGVVAGRGGRRNDYPFSPYAPSKLSIPGKKKLNTTTTTAKLQLLKSVVSSPVVPTKKAKALSAEIQLMRAKERGWK